MDQRDAIAVASVGDEGRLPIGNHLVAAACGVVGNRNPSHRRTPCQGDETWHKQDDVQKVASPEAIIFGEVVGKRQLNIRLRLLWRSKCRRNHSPMTTSPRPPFSVAD
jgi:hypothetical protein